MLARCTSIVFDPPCNTRILLPLQKVVFYIVFLDLLAINIPAGTYEFIVSEKELEH